MKKLHSGGNRRLFCVTKALVILFFYAFTQAAFATNGFSQTTVSLDLNNVEIKNVIKSIENQTEYRFFYTEGLSDMNQKVNVHARNKSVEQVLGEVLSSTRLGYKVNDNKTVIIAPKETMQQDKITGIVTDNTTGEPLVGVSVGVKGTSIGGTTDGNGRYSLTTSNQDVILVFNYLGYKSKEVKIGSSKVFDIALEEDVQLLDEVVVVGYGTQKKANLTGSVSSIASEKIENRPVANLSSSLSGLAAGVTVRQGSGNPGSDGASIRIRGVGTFNNDYRGPMIIVDGSVGSLDSVNPDDVESISVLKDAASAAIYGSRAANGVVLVTTKRGKKEATPRVTYTGIFSSERPGNTYNFETDYTTYMKYFNEAQRNISTSANPIVRYPDSVIEKWGNAKTNPNGMSEYEGVPNWLAYPNTNWNDVLFQDNLYQKHNLSISGGSKNSNYLMSLMYMDNPGTMDNTGLDRYQIRVNLESQIANFLKLGTQTFAMRQRKKPGDPANAFTYMFQTVPGMTPMHDGKFGGPEAAEEDATANNLLKYLYDTGGDKITTRVNTTWYAIAELYKGLTLEGNFNYQDYRYDNESYTVSNDQYSFRTNTVSRYGSNLTTATTAYNSTRDYQYTAKAILNYLNKFGDHDINAMLGYEQFYYNNQTANASMRGLMDFSITQLSSASEMNSISGGEQDYAMISYLGRLNYGYKGKYLFEANFRTDYSSRFSPESRRGTFPSFSAGWRISEESFMASTRDFLDNLKLRASWGELGNTTSGYYDWQAVYGSNNTFASDYRNTYYTFGNTIVKGLAQTKLANPFLKWESITSTGIGLDALLLNQRLNIELDYYDKLTKDILTSPPIYLTMGTVGAPTKNTSDMRNRGFEISAGWNDRIGDVNYSISGNFSYNNNNVENYLGKLDQGWVTDDQGNKTYQTNLGKVNGGSGREVIIEGHQYNEYFLRTHYKGTGTYKNGEGAVDPNGGPKDGMIRTPEDLQWLRDMQAAGYKFGVNTIGKTAMWYGEYIMADTNGDGIYGNDYDRSFLNKSSLPKYGFGINLAASWKGFDFSMQWAGNAGMWYYVYERGVTSTAIGDREAMNSDILKDHYYYNESDPSDPKNNIYSKNTRLRYASQGANMENDAFLYNASYAKLKNLQIGYTFPKAWVQKARINNLRIFLSGENLVTITDFPGLDPEIGASVNVYPTATQYAAGINLTF